MTDRDPLERAIVGIAHGEVISKKAAAVLRLSDVNALAAATLPANWQNCQDFLA
jgi:hypothetical protein